MRNRHMIALLLGVAPIVGAGQLAFAQPANQATTNHQGTHTMPAGEGNVAAEAANSVDAETPAAAAVNTMNSSDDQPPK
ncbi:hypothetical protein [Sphingomonas jatrophae]|uniref:Uncharacterized protein n=1 Tax=Sphingomonas jatrophae TaxID=1166337 RepID=A0A1I6KYE8_9SPHN|nr:hypothetical protein [Sphingomonas jatrophae]SFR96242.1 hypothetical protein SAMN05192580_1956 [Sphingomonas jatrophae]